MYYIYIYVALGFLIPISLSIISAEVSKIEELHNYRKVYKTNEYWICFNMVK